MQSTYIKASVVVPDFNARYSKVWGALRVPDDEVKLDGRVEWTCPHVTLFGGLSTEEKRQNKQISLVMEIVKLNHKCQESLARFCDKYGKILTKAFHACHMWLIF